MDTLKGPFIKLLKLMREVCDTSIQNINFVTEKEGLDNVRGRSLRAQEPPFKIRIQYEFLKNKPKLSDEKIASLVP